MSRVFVIQATRSQPDVSPAKVYGDIIFILTAQDRTSVSFDKSMRKLEGVLANFEPDTDYILWSGGDPLSCMITGAVLSELGYEKFRYLRYERPESRKENAQGFYVPVEVLLNQKDD